MAKNAAASTAANDSNLFGAIAYLLGLITGVIVFLMKDKDSYARFHAIQSILLSIILWVVWIAVMSLTWATLGFGMALWSIVGILFLIVWLFMMWKAYSGERYKLPVIGDFAEKNSKV